MIEQQLKELMELRFGTVKGFAIQNDIPYSTVRSILERGVLKSNAENIFKICDILGIDPKALAEGKFFFIPSHEILSVYNKLDQPRQEKVLNFAQEQLSDQTKKQGVVSRVFEQMRKQQPEAKEIDQIFEVEGTTYAAAAQGFGRGFDADDYDTYTVYTDQEPPYHDYAIGVKGDSMLPKYEEGDMLYLVDRGLSYYNGQLCIVVIDGRTYFKKVYTEDNGLRLVSLNRKYDDIFVELPPEEDTYIRVYDVVGSFTPIDN